MKSMKRTPKISQYLSEWDGTSYSFLCFALVSSQTCFLINVQALKGHIVYWAIVNIVFYCFGYIIKPNALTKE